MVYSHSHRVLTWLKNTRTQNDPHDRTRHEFHISDTFNCTNMSLEQLHQLTAPRFNRNLTKRTIRVTQSYMTSWYTVTATRVLTWLKNSPTQNDHHVRTIGRFHISDTFNCTNMSLEQLHQLTAPRFNRNLTKRTIRVTQSYMT